jgi:hypothetical protein
MNIVMALDNKASDDLGHLAPHKSMYDLNKPRSLTSNARMPKPVASTIANWLDSNDHVNNNMINKNLMHELTS